MGNYYLYCIAYVLTRLMPLKWAYKMSTLLADGHYYFSRTDRKAVQANLKVILGQESVSPSLVRDVFRNFAKYLVDFFTMTKHINSGFIKNRVTIRNLDYLQDALKQGKGCILVGAHLGSWELVGAVLAHLGLPLAVIALPHRDPRVNKFFNDQRQFFGIHVVATNMAVRRCLEEIRDNHVLGILADRDFAQNGMLMNFFGLPTIIPKGAAMFSLKTGAPIITGCCCRTNTDDFVVDFSPPIYPPQIQEAKIDDDQVNACINRYLPQVEAIIRRNPSQWLVFQEFWYHENPRRHPSA